MDFTNPASSASIQGHTQVTCNFAAIQTTRLRCPIPKTGTFQSSQSFAVKVHDVGRGPGCVRRQLPGGGAMSDPEVQWLTRWLASRAARISASLYLLMLARGPPQVIGTIDGGVATAVLNRCMHAMVPHHFLAQQPIACRWQQHNRYLMESNDSEVAPVSYAGPKH